MIVLFLILMVAACCVLYLGHRNQGWLAHPLPAMTSRVAGTAGLMLALACALRSFSTITAICAWLAVAMLVLSLLPFVSLFFAREAST